MTTLLKERVDYTKEQSSRLTREGTENKNLEIRFDWSRKNQRLNPWQRINLKVNSRSIELS